MISAVCLPCRHRSSTLQSPCSTAVSGASLLCLLKQVRIHFIASERIHRSCASAKFDSWWYLTCSAQEASCIMRRVIPDVLQSPTLSLMAADCHLLHRSAFSLDCFNKRLILQLILKVSIMISSPYRLKKRWEICNSFHTRANGLLESWAPAAKVPAPQAEPPLTVATSPMGCPKDVPCMIFLSNLLMLTSLLI